MGHRLTVDTVEFLEHLHRGGQYANYWMLNEAKTYTDEAGLKQKCKRTEWFEVGQVPTTISISDTEHVYFSVFPTTVRREWYQRNTNESVAALNCLFAEFDAKDYGSMDATWAKVASIDPQPSVVVNSGGGYHAYWLLDEPYLLDDTNRRKVITLLYRWVERVGGDEVKDLARVLRLPGFKNVKPKYAPDYPMVGFMKRDMACLYAIDELAAFVPEPAPRPDIHHIRDYDASHLTERRVQAYVSAAVRNIISSVENALDGQKHYELRAAACRMGRLVGAGWMTESEAESLLSNAVHGRAADFGGAVNTIRSGIALGRTRPAQIADREPERQLSSIVRGRYSSDTNTIVRGPHSGPVGQIVRRGARS